jgi:hypothetical protein
MWFAWVVWLQGFAGAEMTYPLLAAWVVGSE